jgi:hypothetical protein
MNVFELIAIWGTGTFAVVGAVLWLNRDLLEKPSRK